MAQRYSESQETSDIVILSPSCIQALSEYMQPMILYAFSLIIIFFSNGPVVYP